MFHNCILPTGEKKTISKKTVLLECKRFQNYEKLLASCILHKWQQRFIISTVMAQLTALESRKDYVWYLFIHQT